MISIGSSSCWPRSRYAVRFSYFHCPALFLGGRAIFMSVGHCQLGITIKESILGLGLAISITRG